MAGADKNQPFFLLRVCFFVCFVHVCPRHTILRKERAARHQRASRSRRGGEANAKCTAAHKRQVERQGGEGKEEEAGTQQQQQRLWTGDRRYSSLSVMNIVCPSPFPFAGFSSSATASTCLLRWEGGEREGGGVGGRRVACSIPIFFLVRKTVIGNDAGN